MTSNRPFVWKLSIPRADRETFYFHTFMDLHAISHKLDLRNRVGNSIVIINGYWTNDHFVAYRQACLPTQIFLLTTLLKCDFYKYIVVQNQLYKKVVEHRLITNRSYKIKSSIFFLEISCHKTGKQRKWDIEVEKALVSPRAHFHVLYNIHVIIVWKFARGQFDWHPHPVYKFSLRL